MTSQGTPEDRKSPDARGESADGNDDGFELAKKALIQNAMRQGFVTHAEIRAALPLEHLSASEIDFLIFTFVSMGIRVVDPSQDPG